MKEIKSILKVLDSPFIDKEPLLDDYVTDQKSLVMKLAFNISNDKYSSDIEAGRDIYGDSFNKHTFEELKSKVRQRALTTLLTVELKKEHQHTREALHHKLFKMLTQAHILLSFGARPTGVKLLLKISHTAEQYSFTDIELLTTHALRLHYWFIGDKAKYDELSNALQRLALLLSCEQSGEHLYFTTTQSFVNSTASKAHLSALFRNSLKEYLKLRKSCDSYSLNINWFNLRVAHLEHEGKFRDVIKECIEATAYIKSKPHFFSQRYYVHFLLAQSGAMLHLQEYDKLLKFTETLRAVIPSRNPNRLIIERNACLANLRSMNLDEANSIINSARKTLQVNILEHVNEEWVLYKGYADLLSSMQTNGKVRNPLLKSGIKNSKDKLGVNLSALILHAIYCIVIRDEKLLNAVDKKIDNYLYRYLNNIRGYERSIAFLKLLRIIIKDDYAIKAISSKGKPYLQFLNHTTFDLEPVEIIPYDTLSSLLIKHITK